MGLDQYLTKRIYVGANYDHRKIAAVINITEGEEKKPIKVNTQKVSYIIEAAGYWRKANQIHKWIVENVQEDEDDCKEYEFNTDKREELLALCKEVKEKAIIKFGLVQNGQAMENGQWTPNMQTGSVIENAEEISEILPTASGFFFGSTDYDQYYMADINDTIEILEESLTEENRDHEYYYTSSW